MIYIVKWEDNITNVFDINLSSEELESKYKDFLLEKAKKLELIVNPYWLNVMDYDLYHQDMDYDKYIKNNKSWEKYLRKWTISYFIVRFDYGVSLEFKESRL